MIAAEVQDNPEIIESLISGGADPDARDTNGTTALMFAAYFQDNPEIIRALINNGASTDLVNNFGSSFESYLSKNSALSGMEF